MKKISGLVLVALLSAFVAGCYSTACQQPAPQPAPMNMKGEG